MSALREAFVEELKDIFDAENQLLRALPKMANAAKNERLRASFEEHEAQTRKQLWRLGEIFGAFEEEPKGKRCKGMQGLIAEAEDIIKKDEGDAALIAAAQKAEHYEIAAYGTLASWAVALGHEDVLSHLTETLNEEKTTDKRLTTIAQTVVNSQESWREPEQPEKPKRPARRAKKATSAKRRATPSRSRARSRTTANSPRSKRQRARAR